MYLICCVYQNKQTKTSAVENAHWINNALLIMEPPTMLLVPICRDMQLWWDKPPIPSPKKCMPSETCFDDVGRICACVTWTQIYVTLQTKNVFHSKAIITLFFNQSFCFFFFRYSFQYIRNFIRSSTQFIHFCRRSAVETIICLGPCTLRHGVWGSLMSA